MLYFLRLDQMDQMMPEVNETQIHRLKDGRMNKFESYRDENLMCFGCVELKSSAHLVDQVRVCQTKKNIYFVFEDEEALQRLQKLAKASKDQAKSLYFFFSELLKDDLDYIEDLEEQINDLEDTLLTDDQGDYIGKIVKYRKILLRQKRYYEQIDQVLDGILENDNGLFAEDDLRYFKILDRKIDRLLAHILNLRDYITQVREAYQSQIDISQNNLMKVFTIVTTLTLPLTLIAGWYGMNLQMPEYGLKYGYPIVIGVSIAVIGLLLLFFKKKKWF